MFKECYILLFLFLSVCGYGQNPNLELGWDVRISEEQFEQNLNDITVSGNIISTQLTGLVRVSKRRKGIELGLGVEKGLLVDSPTFTKKQTSQLWSANLQILGHYYLIDHAAFKVDLQMGLVNQINFSNRASVNGPSFNTYGLNVLGALNFRYKRVLAGVQIQKPIVSDYVVNTQATTVGLRLGFLY